MLQEKFSAKVKFTMIAIWLLFTVSLTVWWLIFSLKQQAMLATLELAQGHAEFLRYQSMLMMEGTTLIFSLLVGGVALTYSSYQQHRKNQQVKDFFATFSHELKTSITSLRLQAESLQDDLALSQHSQLFNRLMKDTVRLELQLENSLFLASAEQMKYFREKISLRKIFEYIQTQWPQLKVHLQGEATLHVDRRALESILKNILQNAVIHGAASEVFFQVQNLPGGKVQLRVKDNGRGFQGKGEHNLGELFQRQSPSSGSAIGLALIKQLVLDHQGRVEFQTQPQFAIILTLPGEGEVLPSPGIQEQR